MTEKVPENCDDLESAVANTDDGDRARQDVLISKAIELGCVDKIPDDWEVEIHE